jgi:hypothetical protein
VKRQHFKVGQKLPADLKVSRRLAVRRIPPPAKKFGPGLTRATTYTEGSETEEVHK